MFSDAITYTWPVRYRCGHTKLFTVGVNPEYYRDYGAARAEAYAIQKRNMQALCLCHECTEQAKTLLPDYWKGVKW